MQLRLTIFTLFIMITLFTPFINAANAQLTSPLSNPTIDTNQCDILVSNLVYIPFSVTIEHDPAVKKIIIPSTKDPASSLNFQGADPTKQERNSTLNPKTHVEFSSNDIDSFSIVLELFHDDKQPNTNHTLTANIFEGEQNTLKTSTKIHYTGNQGCVIFQLSSAKEPHIPTYQETLQLAQKLQNASIDTYTTKVEYYAASAQKSSTVSNFATIAVVILAVFILISNRREKDKLKAMEDNATIQATAFRDGVTVTRQNRQYDILQNEDRQRESMERLNKIVEVIIDRANKSQFLVYNAISDFLILAQQKFNESNSEIPKINLPEKPKEITLEELVTNPSAETIEEVKKTGRLTTAFESIKGALIKKKPKQFSDAEQKFYEEYTKNIEDYRGKFSDMFDELQPKVVQEYKDEIFYSDNKAKLDAIMRILRENDNKWP